MKVEIFKDGELLHTFEGESSSKQAYHKLLSIQSNSTSWAIKYEGYKVVETNQDGTKNIWK